jgi:hypothetical protein
MNCLRRSNFDVLTGPDFEMPIMFRYCGRRLDVGRCEPRADMQADQMSPKKRKRSKLQIGPHFGGLAQLQIRLPELELFASASSPSPLQTRRSFLLLELRHSCKPSVRGND